MTPHVRDFSPYLRELEESRAKWAAVARDNGWYASPFHVQVWYKDGIATGSVSFIGLEHDVLIIDGEVYAV